MIYRKAGDYDTRVIHQVQSVTKDATTGQEVETFTDTGFLWAAYDSDNGTTKRDYGGRETGTDIILRVRGYPVLSALDRLYSPVWEETYVIESIGRGNNEQICNCFRYDTLEV